jgi:RNA polymerase sigma-70 factor, ECF subfamily
VTIHAAERPTVQDIDPTGHNRARFEEHAVPYMQQLYPAALRLTRDRHDAEDLIQETFARAYLKFHQFSGVSLRAWLHRIMTNIFYSGCRKRRSQPSEVLATDMNDAMSCRAEGQRPSMSAEAEALGNLAADSGVLRALRQLPEPYKTVVYLSDIQGYVYGEIADMMQTPRGTVASRIHRGRQMLRAKYLRTGRTTRPTPVPAPFGA